MRPSTQRQNPEAADRTGRASGGAADHDGAPSEAAMRIVLVTGKGGVGKTTVSASTAVAVAERGARTLVVSTDAAHSLSDVLGCRLGPDPTAVAPNLDALHLDGRCELERSWASIADYLRRVLGRTELDELRAEELLVIPGLDQLLALARLRSFVQQQRWDAIVIDCAPSADSLRLLALPDVLSFYLERVFGKSGVMGSWTRRRMERVLSVPVPDDGVIASVASLAEEITHLGALFQSATTTARIVLTPEQVVVAEGQRTLAYLALYGYSVDAVVVNRVLGSEVDGTALQPWRDAQRTQLDAIDRAFTPLALLRARQRPTEPIGVAELGRVGRELYGELDPLGRLANQEAMQIVTALDETILRLPAAGVERDEIRLERVGSDLVVTLGGYRRAIPLPDGLRQKSIRRAGIADGRLEIVFGGE